ncbi:MAG: TDT family transporter [Marinisporobacter sp.]|jgi:exfoliative toxin A/B|nr:TDT family transporter [Marinisporobacter sp.]
MNLIIKKLPIPIAGLMLALAAIGNLLSSYSNFYKSLFGILSSVIMLLLLIKVISMPKSLNEGFNHPVIASVIPTFSMGLMILSTYVKPYFPSLAYYLWLIGLILHVFLILYFTKKYIFTFQIKKVFPSYFIVYVGIVSASVTAPAFNLTSLGQYIFWFGFVAYLILLPFVLYRVFAVKQIPEAAIPTITIFAAPASLCLAGYLKSFPDKNIFMISFLSILSLIMFISVMLYMPKMLKLKFYPSYSAFTFPFVITAIAMKGTYAFLLNTKGIIPHLGNFVKFLELWSIVMVIFVFIKYMLFIVDIPHSISGTTQK